MEQFISWLKRMPLGWKIYILSTILLALGISYGTDSLAPMGIAPGICGILAALIMALEPKSGRW